MTFDELVDFIENRMAMSHIYQPLLIRTLVESGGSATLRQLAHAFLRQDKSQQNTIKRISLISSHDLQLSRIMPSRNSLDIQGRKDYPVACD